MLYQLRKDNHDCFILRSNKKLQKHNSNCLRNTTPYWWEIDFVYLIIFWWKSFLWFPAAARNIRADSAPFSIRPEAKAALSRSISINKNNLFFPIDLYKIRYIKWRIMKVLCFLIKWDYTPGTNIFTRTFFQCFFSIIKAIGYDQCLTSQTLLLRNSEVIMSLYFLMGILCAFSWACLLIE